MHVILLVSLLKDNNIVKKQVINKKLTKLDIDNNKEYKVKTIKNDTIYIKIVAKTKPLKLYY